MSSGRDPFLELQHHRDLEPDPIVMRETIGRSVDAFVRARRPSPKTSAGAWLARFYPSARWRAPVGVAVFALVALFVALPVAMHSLPFHPNAGREALAPRDAPMAEVSREPTASARMGARPLPAPAPPPAEEAISIFVGDGVRVGFRLSPSELELFLPDLGAGRGIDKQILILGEEAEILDAFALSDLDLIAIRLRVDDARFWRVYRLVDGAYVRDADLTARLADASDRAEARQSLAGG